MNQLKSAVIMLFISVCMIFFIDTKVNDIKLDNNVVEPSTQLSINTHIGNLLNSNIRTVVLSIEFRDKLSKMNINSEKIEEILELKPLKISKQTKVVEVSTYDLELGLLTDCSSQDTNNLELEGEYGDYANKVNIIKYYGFKDTLTGNIDIISYYVTKGNPHIINIIDEQDKNGFKLTEWFTSKDAWTPLSGENIEKYDYNTLKSTYFTGSFTGVGENRLEIPVTESENNQSLHLLYVFEPIDKEKTVHIFKGLQNKDTFTIFKEESTSSTVYDTNEDGYILKASKQCQSELSNISNWDDINGSENSIDTVISVKSTTMSIYLLYEKVNKTPIVLAENELNRYFTLNDLSNDLLSVYDTIPKAPAKIYKCELHNGKECKNQDLLLKDNMWSFKIGDDLAVAGDYNNSSFIRDYKLLDNYEITGHTNVNGGNGKDYSIVPNAKFMVYRPYLDNENKVNNLSSSESELSQGILAENNLPKMDLITLYPGKNDVYLELLSRIHLGNNNISKEPLGTRYTNILDDGKRASSGSFGLTLTTNFKYDYHDTKLKWYWPRTECGFDNESEYDVTITKGHDIFALNQYYSFDNNVNINYFIGTESDISQEISNDTEVLNKFSFYPYIKMLFMNDDESQIPIAVTGEHLRTVEFQEIVDITEVNAPIRNKYLFRSALYFPVINNANMGKKLNLFNLKDSLENIPYNIINMTYYNIGMEEEQQSLLYNGDINSLNEINDFINKDIEYNLTNAINDKLLSIEKFNITKELNTIKNIKLMSSTQDVYTLYIDWDGYIIVQKNNHILVKSKDLGEVLLNKEISLLDSKTHIITNLYNSLEESDESKGANGEPWYYEAFDGIEVVVTGVNYKIIK